MSLGMTIVMLIAGWMAVACAMLWGVMRVSRRHHLPSSDNRIVKPRAIREHRHVAAH